VIDINARNRAALCTGAPPGMHLLMAGRNGKGMRSSICISSCMLLRLPSSRARKAGYHAVPMLHFTAQSQVCNPRLPTPHPPTLTRSSLTACCHRLSSNVPIYATAMVHSHAVSLQALIQLPL